MAVIRLGIVRPLQSAIPQQGEFVHPATSRQLSLDPAQRTRTALRAHETCTPRLSSQLPCPCFVHIRCPYALRRVRTEDALSIAYGEIVSVALIVGFFALTWGLAALPSDHPVAGRRPQEEFTR